MIEDIYRIALALPAQSGRLKDDLAIDQVANIDKVYFLSFDRNGNYENSTVSEYNSDIIEQLMLKKKSSNGPNYSPTAQVTEIEKTIKTKLLGWFISIKTSKFSENLPASDKEIIANVINSIHENKEQIIEDYKSRFEKKMSNILSIKIDGKLPIDISFILEFYKYVIREKYKIKNNSTCSLCLREDMGIIPASQAFKFLTFDKPGNISGGFELNKSWRNYPVCMECEMQIVKGKNYIWKNLRFQYVDMFYYLIPSTVRDDNVEILSLIKNINNRKHSFTEEAKNENENVKEDIWDYITDDINDIYSFRLLFVKKTNNAERIEMEIRDVYPSRILGLHETKKEVDKLFEQGYGFSFWMLRRFFIRSDNKNRNKDLDTIFLDITRKIFLGENINKKILFQSFMREIRISLNNVEKPNEYLQMTINAFVCYMFLLKINCICDERRIYMDTKLDGLLEKYKEGLNTDLKRALFLTGAVVRKVKSIQYKEINSAPFQKKLKGMSLRKEEVKGLVKDAQNKMWQYKKQSKASGEIFEIIYEMYLRIPDSDWDMLIDEMNFYIAAGMALSKEVYGFLGEISESNENEKGEG
jgi:CRISPR-associated protein Csh1